MGMKPTEKIWHNGKLIRWEDATIHVLSHVVSYASAVFEGIRCYETKNGPAIFRVREHFERMRNSGKIYRMACWEWGRYLGPEAIENGVDVCISSWNRMAPNTLPSMAKAAANYMNSQLIHMEAATNGYTEGIALDTNGFVSEGSGENIFVAMDGALITPPIGSSVLPGITRNSVMTLCDDLKIPVREQMIPREMLYIADEVFFTGTAAEITPLRSVDRIKVGKGSRGPLTKALQEEFFAILTGSRPDRHNWLTPVSVPLGAGTR